MGRTASVFPNMMTHQQVIDNFIKEGKAGSGTYVKSTGDLLYSKFPSGYSPYGHRWGNVAGRQAPLGSLGREWWGYVQVQGIGFIYKVYVVSAAWLSVSSYYTE